MQALQTERDGTPSNAANDEPSSQQSADVLTPLLRRLQGSLGELDEQIRTGKPASEAPAASSTLVQVERAHLQQAHAQMEALLNERTELLRSLEATKRELAQALTLVQRQRTALIEARMGADRNESAMRKLRIRADHYQETVARLLNLPPRDTKIVRR